jgi:hypothetical protein
VIAGCAASIPASTPMTTAQGVAPERAALTTVVKADTAEAPAPVDHNAMMSQMAQTTHMAGMPENCPLRKAQALTGKLPKHCPLAGRALTP